MRSRTAFSPRCSPRGPLATKAVSSAEHGVMGRRVEREGATAGLVRWLGRLVIALALLSEIIAGPSVAQSPTPTSSPDKPPQVREFLELLDDPAVRDWLQTQRTANQAPTSATPSEKARIEGYFGARVMAIQQHFASLAATFPMLPADLEQAAATLAADFHERGLIEILLLLGGFVTLGFGAEWLFGRITVAAASASAI